MYLNIEEKYLEQRGKTLDSTQVRLQMMMQYIHENYKEKISLEDISNHGNCRAGYGEQEYGIESVPKISSRYAGALSGEVSSAGGCKITCYDGKENSSDFGM